jgi:hypothetical protein
MRSQRNEIAHSSLFRSEPGERAPVHRVPYFSYGEQFKLKPRKKKLSPDDIAQRRVAFEEIANAVGWFADFAARVDRPHEAERSPDTALIRQLRATVGEPSSAG